MTFLLFNFFVLTQLLLSPIKKSIFLILNLFAIVNNLQKNFNFFRFFKTCTGSSKFEKCIMNAKN